MISNSTTFNLIKVATFTDIPATFLESTCYYTIDTEKYYIWRNSIYEEIFIGGGSFVGLIDILHADLVIAKAAGELIPGVSYRITDFQTIYDQPDYMDEYLPKPTVELKMSAIDPIIVKAVTESELELDAFQESYPLDKIKYILEYTTLFSSTPTKGRIIERIDEWDNRTDFDHRTVLFKRYANLPYDMYTNDVLYCNHWDSSQDYPGREYDIVTNVPILSDSQYPTDYHTFICSTSGTRDFGSGPITVEVGDVMEYDGSKWTKLNGWTELTMFNFSQSEKPQNNYIEGTYYANLSNSDASWEVEPIFDLPNIVFLDNITHGNKFLAACTNSTFCGETSSNTFAGLVTNVIVGFKQRASCISNTIDYRCKGVKISEHFVGNRIQGITYVNIRGGFRTNTAVFVYGLTGTMTVDTNTFVELYDVTSSFDEQSNLSIRANNITYVSDLEFNNSGRFAEFGWVTGTQINNCWFYEGGGLFYCDFKYFSANRVYQDPIAYCKGNFLADNIFYGFCGYSDFGPRFTHNKVGTGFGRELVSQLYPAGFDADVSNTAYSNVFKAEVVYSEIGSNFSGNIVDCSLPEVIFPDFFQNNHIKRIARDQFNNTIDLSGIPELVSPIATTIDARSVKITQQIFDDNFVTLSNTPLIFQDIDENGDDRYWTRAFGFQWNNMPFMNKSTTYAGATGMAIGSGYENSALIGKTDLYSKKGAISQVLYYGSDTSNICVPSLDELQLMYADKVALGIFGSGIYWSSSEITATLAYAVDFSDGSICVLPKTEIHGVIPIKYVSHFGAVVLTYIDEYGSNIVKSIF